MEKCHSGLGAKSGPLGPHTGMLLVVRGGVVVVGRGQGEADAKGLSTGCRASKPHLLFPVCHQPGIPLTGCRLLLVENFKDNCVGS